MLEVTPRGVGDQPTLGRRHEQTAAGPTPDPRETARLQNPRRLTHCGDAYPKARSQFRLRTDQVPLAPPPTANVLLDLRGNLRTQGAATRLTHRLHNHRRH